MLVTGRWFLGAGLLGLALVWGPWFTALAGSGFTAHMLRHTMLVTVIALAFALTMPRRWSAWMPAALIGAGLEFAIVWGWHLPMLHHLAGSGPIWRAVEQASFLGAGLVVWTGALTAPSPLIGAGVLLLTSMHMTLLGALLVLARGDLYGAGAGAVADQQIGGLVMLGIGTPIYLVAGLWLTGRALMDPAPARSS